MLKIFRYFIFLVCLLSVRIQAQTTNGIITGVVTDTTGALIRDANISITNQETGLLRTTKSDSKGYYVIPQLAPGTYSVSVEKDGFATETRQNTRIEVNQNATLNITMPVSSAAQKIEVIDGAPPLNTTSATLGTVIDHKTLVDLPLNGRQFTQLTLLAPGAAPVEASQQSSDIVSLGSGGVVPAVNGQRPRNDNFTMDGVLNNSTFVNSWAISPPPDAIQEFNVQSHITDAQFSISTGANINIDSRAGTNTFHGSAWEFLRNDVLDGIKYPATQRNPYKQNQYGVYLGGPVELPHWSGKNNTWFSVYWEGFRSGNSLTYLGNTLTDAMRGGDFSALLGAKVGTDSLGRDEYKNEIYDPTTSRPDPKVKGAIIRDPFSGNVIPKGSINAASLAVLQKYYPEPNLNVPASVLPNISFISVETIKSDQVGIRIDHRLGANDLIFGRYNRSNINDASHEPLPGYVNDNLNYAQQYVGGYTHLFGQKTVLNLRYGYTDATITNLDTPAGSDFVNSLKLSQFLPPVEGTSLGPTINISNGYSGVNQAATITGPQKSSDTHADVSRVMGQHTFGAGGMYYRISSNSGGFGSTVSFTQNATSQAAAAGTTGMGPASFLLGLPDSYKVTAGDVSMGMTVNWYGGYAQDQWQVSKRLSLTYGLRYDYVSPPNYSKTISALDIPTGQFVITQPFLPLYPTAIGSSHLFYPQYNGFQPRFGINYLAAKKTVLHGAFAVMDDHNNNTVQLYADPRLSWPTAVQTTVSLLNRSTPSTFFDQLPASTTFLNSTTIYPGYAVDTHNRITYSLEYNAGIEQQLTDTLSLNINYVGSRTHNEVIKALGNTAMVPGPGSLASRGQPYPQFGSTFQFASDSQPASYDALQAQLKKSLSSGLLLMVSYTWSKSLDVQSDAYASVPQNIYDLHADWGPSDYDLRHIFVFTGIYALPVGRGKNYFPNPNRFAQAVVGDWNVSSIVSLHSGLPFDITAGGDVANVGAGTQRANQIGNPYSGSGFKQSRDAWINPAAFAAPQQYTFGNESRNNLVGPSSKNVDLSLYKNFPFAERALVQFRSEFFNAFNHPNYGTPTANVTSASLGQITSAQAAREIQFALKLMF